MNNRTWADAIIKRWAPSYRHRWEVFESYFNEYLNGNTIWLDLGCGHNADIEEKKQRAFYAAGVDVFKNEPLLARPFILSDITVLPFKSNTVDLVSMRFVMEHIAHPRALFEELNRVLKPGGKLLFSTTNVWSPVIFIPKLLPYSFRKRLILKIFKVQDEDIFPTYHRFNSFLKIKKRFQGMKLKELNFIQDLNAVNRVMFLSFFIWHIITSVGLLERLRSNLIAVYEKEL